MKYWTEDEDDKLIRMKLRGETNIAAGEVLGRSPDSVSKRLRQLSVDSRQRKWTTKEDSEIAAYMGQGLSFAEMAEFMELPVGQLRGRGAMIRLSPGRMAELSENVDARVANQMSANKDLCVQINNYWALRGYQANARAERKKVALTHFYEHGFRKKRKKPKLVESVEIVTDLVFEWTKNGYAVVRPRRGPVTL